jgi:23S rRNA (uracil1939-C5)-methyltransferase
MSADTFIVTLEKLTCGGDAMGHLPDPLTGASGRAVFVPYALPGERVRVRLVEVKRGYARAELLEVLGPSAERISPRCKHYFSPLARSSGEGPGPVLPVLADRPGSKVGGVRACGGCHYQHMPYKAQLRAKEAILRDQLERIGQIENPPIWPMVPSPFEWNYRNHVQFHLTAEGKLGYMGAGTGDGHRPSPSEVVAISECHLPETSLNALWPQLEFEPHSGLERVSLRLGADEDMMLILESKDPNPPELEIEADISVVHLSAEDTVVLAGDDYIVVRALDRPFRVSAGSFFQVNTAMAGKMAEDLLTNLPISPNTTLLDVYCGVGLFSAFLAPRVGRLIGIESSPSACEDFVVNLDEFENVELYEAPAEEVLPALDVHPDILLVDPPRAGLDRRALDAILTMKPGTLAYVACDPATLGRDAARLIAGGYQLKQVTPFDLFPQTYHIESISIFETT